MHAWEQQELQITKNRMRQAEKGEYKYEKNGHEIKKSQRPNSSWG